MVSASMSRAEAMTAWMLKTIADVPWLKHMLPDSHSGRYSRIAFDVGTCQFIEQSPSVRAAGITGQVTGSRASVILIDDGETPTTALTQVQREKLRNILNEMEAILKPGPESKSSTWAPAQRHRLHLLRPASRPELLEAYVARSRPLGPDAIQGLPRSADREAHGHRRRKADRHTL